MRESFVKVLRYLAEGYFITTGGNMKRLITFAIIVLVSGSNSFAQFYTSHSNTRSNNGKNLKKEIRELQNFEDKLDQFSYSMQVGDIRSAQRLKAQLLSKMENEIIQNRRSILEPRFQNRPSATRKYSRYDNQLYSKRNGSIRSGLRNEDWETLDRLQEQRDLYRRFEVLDLTRGRRGIINENKHRRIIYQFRDVMREEIQVERDKTRRRNNNSRG